MEIKQVPVAQLPGANVILGHAHFVKTVEDLYEVMVNAHAAIKFGVAFCEASGPRLVRHDGNDPELERAAVAIARDVACGHFFAIVMREGFPINVLKDVAACREVCQVYCATANPLAVLVAETPAGRGVVGVIDGEPPLGVEGEREAGERKAMLRKFGYKR